MSLINDMLRDLEKRNPEKSGTSTGATPVIAAGSTVKLFLLAGGILLLVGMIWVGVKLRPGLPPATPVAVTVAAQPDPVPVAVTGGVAAVVPTEAVGSAGSVDPAAVVPEPPMVQLLRLEIEGVEDAAHLSLVFAERPEYQLLHTEPGEGEFQINFPRTQIGSDLEIPPLTGTLLKRVSLVPQKETLQLLVGLSDRARVDGFQLVDAADQGCRLLIEIVTAEPVVEIPRQKRSVTGTNPAVADKTKPSAPAKASKNRHQPSRDQQAYRSGLRQLKQGNLAAAEVSFNQALAVNPERIDVRLQLVRLLQQRMQLSRAEEVLQLGLSLTPGNPDLRKIYARQLLHQKLYVKAIQLLKTEPVPAVIHDAEYHALLAALLQESGQYHAAGSIYGQLVQIQPQQALWWMGMAISLEQTGNPDSAYEAYGKALRLPGLRPDLQHYIQGRLQSL